MVVCCDCYSWFCDGLLFIAGDDGCELCYHFQTGRPHHVDCNEFLLAFRWGLHSGGRFSAVAANNIIQHSDDIHPKSSSPGIMPRVFLIDVKARNHCTGGLFFRLIGRRSSGVEDGLFLCKEKRNFSVSLIFRLPSGEEFSKAKSSLLTNTPPLNTPATWKFYSDNKYNQWAGKLS